MSDDAPKMSIAERVAALQNQGKDDALPALTKPKAKKTSALSDRIAALQKTAGPSTDGEGSSAVNKPKVGKLKKPPPGAVPIMPMGIGPPPSLLRKQKEREERMAQLQQEANASEVEPKEEVKEKPKVGKLKPPAGAVPIMPFGAGPPPSLLKKQKEREERMAKLQQEAQSTEGGSSSVDVDVYDALLTRPTIQGKRRPRTKRA